MFESNTPAQEKTIETIASEVIRRMADQGSSRLMVLKNYLINQISQKPLVMKTDEVRSAVQYAIAGYIQELLKRLEENQSPVLSFEGIKTLIQLLQDSMGGMDDDFAVLHWYLLVGLFDKLAIGPTLIPLIFHTQLSESHLKKIDEKDLRDFNEKVSQLLNTMAPRLVTQEKRIACETIFISVIRSSMCFLGDTAYDGFYLHLIHSFAGSITGSSRHYQRRLGELFEEILAGINITGNSDLSEDYQSLKKIVGNLKQTPPEGNSDELLITAQQLVELIESEKMQDINMLMIFIVTLKRQNPHAFQIDIVFDTLKKVVSKLIEEWKIKLSSSENGNVYDFEARLTMMMHTVFSGPRRDDEFLLMHWQTILDFCTESRSTFCTFFPAFLIGLMNETTVSEIETERLKVLITFFAEVTERSFLSEKIAPIIWNHIQSLMRNLLSTLKINAHQDFYEHLLTSFEKFLRTSNPDINALFAEYLFQILQQLPLLQSPIRPSIESAYQVFLSKEKHREILDMIGRLKSNPCKKLPPNELSEVIDQMNQYVTSILTKFDTMANMRHFSVKKAGISELELKMNELDSFFNINDGGKNFSELVSEVEKLVSECQKALKPVQRNGIFKNLFRDIRERKYVTLNYSKCIQTFNRL